MQGFEQSRRSGASRKQQRGAAARRTRAQGYDLWVRLEWQEVEIVPSAGVGEFELHVRLAGDVPHAWRDEFNRIVRGHPAEARGRAWRSVTLEGNTITVDGLKRGVEDQVRSYLDEVVGSIDPVLQQRERESEAKRSASALGIEEDKQAAQEMEDRLRRLAHEDG